MMTAPSLPDWAVDKFSALFDQHPATDTAGNDFTNILKAMEITEDDPYGKGLFMMGLMVAGQDHQKMTEFLTALLESEPNLDIADYMRFYNQLFEDGVWIIPSVMDTKKTIEGSVAGLLVDIGTDQAIAQAKLLLEQHELFVDSSTHQALAEMVDKLYQTGNLTDQEALAHLYNKVYGKKKSYHQFTMSQDNIFEGILDKLPKPVQACALVHTMTGAPIPGTEQKSIYWSAFNGNEWVEQTFLLCGNEIADYLKTHEDTLRIKPKSSFSFFNFALKHGPGYPTHAWDALSKINSRSRHDEQSNMGRLEMIRDKVCFDLIRWIRGNETALVDFQAGVNELVAHYENTMPTSSRHFSAEMLEWVVVKSEYASFFKNKNHRNIVKDALLAIYPSHTFSQKFS